MKSLLASIAAVGLIASPVLAAPKPAPKASSATMKEAKAEGESVKTEVKEKKMAAAHHKARHHKKSTKMASTSKKASSAKTSTKINTKSKG